MLELFTERDHKTAEVHMIKINDIKGHAFDDLDWIWIYLMAQGSMLHFLNSSDKYSDVKNTGCFIMYSGITKIFYRKTVEHVFTKPVQIEGTTQNFCSPQ
jgi:hypothetical protein